MATLRTLFSRACCATCRAREADGPVREKFEPEMAKAGSGLETFGDRGVAG